MYLIVTILFSFISYIVDNIWTHDKDLPAIRNEQGHYNNQVRIKTAPEGIMLIKNPREENLIQAAAAKAEAQSSQKIARKAKAEAEVKFVKLNVSPKRNEEKIRENASRRPASPNAKAYELQKCLSDDGTLVMSDQGILSQNETMMFIDAEGGN
jgi:hypothetical protein